MWSELFKQVVIDFQDYFDVSSLKEDLFFTEGNYFHRFLKFSDFLRIYNDEDKVGSWDLFLQYVGSGMGISYERALQEIISAFQFYSRQKRSFSDNFLVCFKVRALRYYVSDISIFPYRWQEMVSQAFNGNFSLLQKKISNYSRLYGEKGSEEVFQKIFLCIKRRV